MIPPVSSMIIVIRLLLPKLYFLYLFLLQQWVALESISPVQLKAVCNRRPIYLYLNSLKILIYIILNIHIKSNHF